MKGGKAGRKRRASTNSPARPATPAAKGAKAGAGKRPANAAPPKGSRKKPEYGGTSSKGDD
jgi:hypothetical protein